MAVELVDLDQRGPRDVVNPPGDHPQDQDLQGAEALHPVLTLARPSARTRRVADEGGTTFRLHLDPAIQPGVLSPAADSDPHLRPSARMSSWAASGPQVPAA